ncbi:hypothetical protein [Dyella flagellata]|uniref:Uncharacterized protein n=1 Tax=Dyella flagellata TaxID=1867833 RepID=A0ABQ5X9P7_9GAMM|nr:hypothetical protein [Dyella flagellata]GLQ87255.1 hypothetical protein GCM10007898_08210 [Dyella flagellata]
MAADNTKTNLFGRDDAGSEMFTKAIGALDNLETDQETIEAKHFKKLYPSILKAIEQGHSIAKILKTLGDAGFKIHPAKFKKLMAKLDDAKASSATVATENATEVPCER